MTRRVILFAALALVGGSLVRAQNETAAPVQDNQSVDFCEMVRHPEKYDGKIVKVTATYVPSFHTALFLDDACTQTKPYEEVMANARFAKDESGTAAFKKLDKFLRKYRTGRARVTMVAIFRDPLQSGILVGCSGCSQYKLEVQRILTVERTNAPVAKGVHNH